MGLGIAENAFQIQHKKACTHLENIVPKILTSLESFWKIEYKNILTISKKYRDVVLVAF